MDCYIWYSEEGTGRAAAPPRLCGFIVGIKGLMKCYIRHKRVELRLEDCQCVTAKNCHTQRVEISCPDVCRAFVVFTSL